MTAFAAALPKAARSKSAILSNELIGRDCDRLRARPGFQFSSGVVPVKMGGFGYDAEFHSAM
jgi:hypothetical protein